jgi:hypothetical protein
VILLVSDSGEARLLGTKQGEERVILVAKPSYPQLQNLLGLSFSVAEYSLRKGTSSHPTTVLPQTNQGSFDRPVDL